MAVVNRTVWLVGSFLDKTSGNQLALVARNTGSGWKAVSAPNPGNGDRILGGISAAGGTAWAVGAFDSSHIKWSQALATDSQECVSRERELYACLWRRSPVMASICITK